MHVVRPSVVLVLVWPRRSSQNSNSASILTYPVFGISWSINQFMSSSACTSGSGRSKGSWTASGLEGASYCICRFTRAVPFLLDTFPLWSGLVFKRLHCALVSSSLLHSKSSISSASWSFSSQSSLFVFRVKSVLIGAKKMRFDKYAGCCIVSNFQLHRDSHSQIPTATDTPSAPTLARSNLIRLPSLDWPSWLLLPHQEITRVILCRLIYIIMSFKPFNDIIMIVCKFLIGLCCLRSYLT